MLEKPVHRFLAEAVIVSLVGIVMALTGAFGTADLPLAMRFAYWIGGFLLAGLALQIILMATRQVTRVLMWPEPAAYLLAVPLLAVAIFLALSSVISIPGGAAPMLYFSILGVGLAFFVLFGGIYARRERKAAQDEAGLRALPPTSAQPASNQHISDEPEPVGISGTALHARLPPGFPPIIALSSEDHYVKVHAEGRSAVILSTLGDAILAVGGEKGMRVHRSWWAAQNAVAGAKRAGRMVYLHLHGGLKVPVSRANIGAVRQAKWLR